MIRRRHLLTSLALSAALALSACGAGGDVAPLNQADFFSQTARAQDGDDTTFHVTSRAGSGQESSRTTGVVRGARDPKDIEFAVTGSDGSTDVEFRQVDGVLYVDLGEELGGKFLALDLTDSSNPLAQQFGRLFGTFDPRQTLRNAKDAVTDFEAGQDTTTIDGVETRRYTLTIDTAKAFEVASQGLEIPPGTLAKLPESSTTTVWLGPDDLPRRVRGSLLDVTFTNDFTRWGEPVEIAKPKASQIETDNPFASLD